MTALNWVMLDQALVLSMDSMAHQVVEDKFQVHGFWTKLFPLPHLKGVMVVTGLMQVGLDWFRVLQENILAQDFLYVDSIATSQLRNIAERYADQHEGTTTVYHFGVDPVARRLRGFAYRSANQFRSEELPTGCAVKPPDSELLKAIEQLVTEQGVFVGLVELMRLQKAKDDALPPGQRVGIGGEIHMLTLDASGRQCVWTAHQFPDFDTGYREALERLELETFPPGPLLGGAE